MELAPHLTLDLQRNVDTPAVLVRNRGRDGFALRVHPHPRRRHDRQGKGFGPPDRGPQLCNCLCNCFQYVIRIDLHAHALVAAREERARDPAGYLSVAQDRRLDGRRADVDSEKIHGGRVSAPRRRAQSPLGCWVVPTWCAPWDPPGTSWAVWSCDHSV